MLSWRARKPAVRGAQEGNPAPTEGTRDQMTQIATQIVVNVSKVSKFISRLMVHQDRLAKPAARVRKLSEQVSLSGENLVVMRARKWETESLKCGSRMSKTANGACVFTSKLKKAGQAGTRARSNTHMCLVLVSVNIARINYIERRDPERIIGRWEGLKRSHFSLSTVRWKAALGRRSGLLSAAQSESQLQGNES